MKHLTLVLIALPTLAASTIPTGLATIDDCTTAAGGPNSVTVLSNLIFGSQAYRDFIYAAPCWSVVGGGGGSSIPACTVANSGFEQWCTILTYSTGTVVQCAWMQLNAGSSLSIFDFAVGVDANGDGHIMPNEPTFRTGRPLTSAPVGSVFRITFTVPTDFSGNPITGRLIVYPVSLVPGGDPLDLSVHLCQ